MRSIRSWAWRSLGAGSLLVFVTACGSVTESFSINFPPADVDGSSRDDAAPDANADAGTDATAPDGATPDATVPDGAVPDATVPDATVPDATTPDATTPDATVPDSSVQDARVDAAPVDATPVVPEGGSLVDTGDGAVVVPPFDPTLLDGTDGGIVVIDGGLATADGGTLTPRQFRDLVNGITCDRISKCCCPGCDATEQAQVVSRTKCETGLGSFGMKFILIRNEDIAEEARQHDSIAMAQCVASLGTATSSCGSLTATSIQALRDVCLRAFVSTRSLGSACTSGWNCAGAARCATEDAGRVCRPLLGIGESCSAQTECTPRGVLGVPPNYCGAADGGATCRPYLSPGDICPHDTSCGAGVCIPDVAGVNRCSSIMPFAGATDPASYCTTFRP